jgi:hypothetical protein
MPIQSILESASSVGDVVRSFPSLSPGGSADAVAKQEEDLLHKYEAAERELIALKAKSRPRRLSSAQKDFLRQKIPSFTTKTIWVSCVNGGQETSDFAQDFIAAFNAGHFPGCSQIVGFSPNLPLVQVEAGLDRQNDADILVKALTDIGINKNEIARKPSDNRALLFITIGPKAP